MINDFWDGVITAIGAVIFICVVFVIVFLPANSPRYEENNYD